MEDQCDVVPRDFLCCPLCREEYQEPKFLPCLHSFCKACIDVHIDATTTPDGFFTCPVCGTETPVADDEETPTLTDNAFARRLSCPAVIQGKSDKLCQQCQVSGTNSDATTHCIECDEFLCGQCSLTHLEQEETSRHKTQSVSEYINHDSPVQPTSSSILAKCCDYYDAYDIGSMYCIECDISLCADCHSSSHNDHKCAELGAIAQNFENKIKDPLRELKRDKHRMNKAMAELHSVKRHVGKKQKELIHTVKQRTKTLCTLIQDYESVLLMEIDKKHRENLGAVEEREDTISRHIASINAVTELTEKLLTFGSEEEKVSMRKKIGRRVRELCEENLPSKHVDLTNLKLSEPTVTAETVCDLFGEVKHDPMSQPVVKRKMLTNSHSIDMGMVSRHSTNSMSSTEDPHTELTDLEEYQDGEDADMLSASNTSDVFRSNMLSNSADSNHMSGISNQGSDDSNNPSVNGSSGGNQEVPNIQTDTSFQSSVQDEVPCHNLEEPKKELEFPATIQDDSIKGVGVNSHGDVVVGTVSQNGESKVYILEKHGIIRGQIPVEKNWGIHSVAPDGKVNLIITRSDNKYKVRVVSGESNQRILVDMHIESFGLNSLTATKAGYLLVTSNRYAHSNPTLGKAAKSGGNITIYNQEGAVIRILNNDTFADLNMYLFDRPHNIATDHHDNIFVADPGRHSVMGFKPDGQFMFEFGNTDAEEELYQGPDAISTDRYGNVIVLDKKDGRIDILNYEGQLQRCYFPSEHVRFFSVTPDKLLMLVNSEGSVKYFDYMQA